MKAPRRYRLALRLYPGRWRREHGDDLLAILADGDDERGRPSTREAWALAGHGLLARGRIAPTAQQRLLVAAAVALLLASVLPARYWAQRVLDAGVSAGVPVVDGPPPAGRALLAAVAVVVLSACVPRLSRSAPLAFVGCAAIELVIQAGVAWSRTPWHGLNVSLDMIAPAVGFALGAALAVAVVQRRPPRQQRLICAAAAIAIVVPTLVAATTLDGPGAGPTAPLMPWHLGPAGLLTLAAGAAALLALIAATMRPLEAR